MTGPAGGGASCSWPWRLVVVAGIGVAGVRFDQLGDRIAEQGVRAVLLSTADAAAIVPTDLPSNDVTRQVYVVWGTSTPEPVALATFDVTVSDADVRLLAWSPDAHRHNGFGISLEEGRTAPARSSSVLASGQVGPT